MDLNKLFGIEKRNVSSNCSCASYGDFSFKSIRNEAGAMNLSTVFRCTDIISDSIATLPIKIKIKNGKCISEADNHPLSIVLSDRNTTLISKYQLIKLLIQSVILRGNGFAYIHRANDGTPTALQFLESNQVTINYNQATNDLWYTSNFIKGRILPKDMIHLKKYTYDSIHGISLLTFASRSVDLAHSAEENAVNFYKDGSNLQGILSVQGVLSDAQKHQIRDNWENNNGRLKVLQGNMSYTPLSISPQDAQLLDTRKYNSEDLCKFFGIPSSMLGIGNPTYQTLEQDQKAFILHTLMPYIQMIEEEFNRKLLSISESNLFVDFEEEFILKSDNASMASYLSTLLNCGVICIDEARSMLGMSEIGLTKHIVPYTDINQNTINNEANTNEQ